MKALVKFGKGREGMELRDVPMPVIKEGELLVKILAAGICGTDLHIMNDEFPAIMPVTIGHEFIGSIVEVGSDVKGFELGDQIVSMTAAVTCGSCTYCKHGIPMLCSNRKSIGSGVNGAMAEYMAIPADISFKLPENRKNDLSMVVCEPAACCVRSVDHSKLVAGDVTVITGPGPMGQLTMQLAKLQGAFVIMAGTPADKERLAFAKELGADVTVDDPEKLKETVLHYSPLGADVAFEASGYGPVFNSLVSLLKPGGNLAQLGLYGKPITVDMDALLKKEIVLTVSNASARSSWERLLRLAGEDRLNLGKFVSATFPLEKWNEAFDMALNKQGYKIVFIP